MRYLSTIFLSVFAFCSATLYGQERDSINVRQLNIDVHKALESPSTDYAPLPAVSSPLSRVDDYTSYLKKKYPIADSQVLPQWATSPMPYTNVNKPLTYRNLYLTGGYDIIPGIGYTNTATGGWYYRPNDRWTLHASTSAFKSIQQAGRFSDIQFNASATYRINSWMSISGHGYYDINGKDNARRGAIPMAGYNAGYKGLGSTLNLKVINRDSWELWMKSGVDYCYDPKSMKWEWKPIVTPEIRFK